MSRALLAASAIMFAPLAPAVAQQTIVGKWAIHGKCGAPLSVIVIGAMELVGEDFYCDFRTVRRTGDSVNWRGQCNFSENGYEPASVTARLSRGKLRYSIAGQGGWNGPFERCPK